MNKYQLFNKPINVKSAYSFIQKRGFKISKAVEANADASRLMNRQYKTYDTRANKDINLWKESLKCDQYRNAYAWMMIKTSIDEHEQGWLYMEDGQKYIEKIVSQGAKFTDEQREIISLIRYFGNLSFKATNGRNLGDFTSENLQYWFMVRDDLGSEENEKMANRS